MRVGGTDTFRSRREIPPRQHVADVAQIDFGDRAFGLSNGSRSILALHFAASPQSSVRERSINSTIASTRIRSSIFLGRADRGLLREAHAPEEAAAPLAAGTQWTSAFLSAGASAKAEALAATQPTCPREAEASLRRRQAEVAAIL
jgi:hypothetical protein